MQIKTIFHMLDHDKNYLKGSINELKTSFTVKYENHNIKQMKFSVDYAKYLYPK